MIKHVGVPFDQYKNRVCNHVDTWVGGTMEEHCKFIAYAYTKNFTEEQARFHLKHKR